jgi:hypothetical protein
VAGGAGEVFGEMDHLVGQRVELVGQALVVPSTCLVPALVVPVGGGLQELVEPGDRSVVVVEHGAGDAVELAAGGRPAQQLGPARDAVSGRRQPGCVDQRPGRLGTPSAQLI